MHCREERAAAQREPVPGKVLSPCVYCAAHREPSRRHPQSCSSSPGLPPKVLAFLCVFAPVLGKMIDSSTTSHSRIVARWFRAARDEPLARRCVRSSVDRMRRTLNRTGVSRRKREPKFKCRQTPQPDHRPLLRPWCPYTLLGRAQKYRRTDPGTIGRGEPATRSVVK